MKSPLFFISDNKWAALCDKYHVSVKFKPRKLGSGISATAYTFGKRLVIKHTDCESTVNVAKKLRRKKLDVVAKVYEVGKASRNLDSWNTYGDSYYIVQELVKKRKSPKVKEFCLNFEDLARALSNVDDARMLKSFVDIALKLKRCGIDLGEISDLHYDNVFATRKGGIKIIDLGCLDFGGC